MNIFIVLILIAILLVLSSVLTAIKELPVGVTNSSITDFHKESFKKGVNHNWAVVQTILYKLYKEDTLLDYDSLHNKIKENMLMFENDINSLNKWNKKYIDHITKEESK